VNRADLAIFTHEGYRKSLKTRGPGAVLIDPATWIAEQQVLLTSDAARKRDGLSKTRLRVLFAGRLLHGKGLATLLSALRELDSRFIELDVDIIGEGPMQAACEAAVVVNGTAKVRLLAPVPYGEQFFSLLQNYHAVVVPSLTNEQPRIIFDAFSQGVPVLASDTDGNKSCVEDGVTGRLFRHNDIEALSNVLQQYAKDPGQLRILGMNSLGVAHRFTHNAMHERRREALLALFSRNPTSGKLSVYCEPADIRPLDR
jgi:glycosyltransferase involved in cell wall biosynthesis